LHVLAVCARWRFARAGGLRALAVCACWRFARAGGLRVLAVRSLVHLSSLDVGFDHINRNPPVIIRTPKLTRFEPAQYWGGGPPGNSVVLNPFFLLPALAVCAYCVLAVCAC
jgi:hypothetical protein